MNPSLVPSKSPWTVLFTAIVMAFLNAACAPMVIAQLEGRIADKPLGTGFVRNVTQITIFEYITSLGKRLEIAKTFTDQIGGAELDELNSKVEQPINGVAYYLVQGLIPSWETVYFQQVVDADEVTAILKKRKEMFGENSTLKTEDNGCFKFENAHSWTTPLPEGVDPEQHVAQQNAMSTPGNRGFRRTAELSEEDGKPVIKESYVQIEYFRLHDQLLFSGNFEELWTMNLPDAESLTRAGRGENDMGLEIFFSRIPEGIKQLGWGVLSGTAGVQMQQRDNEDESIAELRSTSMQFGLDLLKSIIFDVDETQSWLRFADDNNYSIRGQINFVSRRNSQLAEQLKDLSSGSSRFGPILKDQAPATIHLCAKLFRESDPMLLAAGKRLETLLASLPESDATLKSAGTEIARSLEGIARHRTLEMLLKAGWSEASSGVIYGGIQVDNNPALLKAVYDLATNMPGAPQGVLSLVDKDGRQVIQVTFPGFITEEIAKHTSLKLSHGWIAHENSCLWFAVGGENSFEMLKQCFERCGEQGLAMRTPLFSAAVDVDQWLQLPQDDPTGVGGLLLWMDANQPAFPPGPMMLAFGTTDESKPAAILQRVLDLGGDRDASFTVISDSSGLQADLKLGEAIANYQLARMLDMQDRMMSRNIQEVSEVPAVEDSNAE